MTPKDTLMPNFMQNVERFELNISELKILPLKIQKINDIIKLNDVSKILIAYSVLLIRIHLAAKFHKNPIVRFCVMLSDSNCTHSDCLSFYKRGFIQEI